MQRLRGLAASGLAAGGPSPGGLAAGWPSPGGLAARGPSAGGLAAGGGSGQAVGRLEVGLRLQRLQRLGGGVQVARAQGGQLAHPGRQAARHAEQVGARARGHGAHVHLGQLLLLLCGRRKTHASVLAGTLRFNILLISISNYCCAVD